MREREHCVGIAPREREGGREPGRRETREKVAAARLWLPPAAAFRFFLCVCFAFAAEKEGEEEAWRGGGHVPGEREFF